MDVRLTDVSQAQAIALLDGQDVAVRAGDLGVPRGRGLRNGQGRLSRQPRKDILKGVCLRTPR